MYADITSLLIIKHLSSTAEEVLSDAANWFGANNFESNFEKSPSPQFTRGVVGGGAQKFLGMQL